MLNFIADSWLVKFLGLKQIKEKTMYPWGTRETDYITKCDQLFDYMSICASTCT